MLIELSKKIWMLTLKTLVWLLRSRKCLCYMFDVGAQSRCLLAFFLAVNFIYVKSIAKKRTLVFVIYFNKAQKTLLSWLKMTNSDTIMLLFLFPRP